MALNRLEALIKVLAAAQTFADALVDSKSANAMAEATEIREAARIVIETEHAHDDLVDALNKLWAFGSNMVDRHGENGDATMTTADHRAWQDAGGAANAVLNRLDAHKGIKNP